MKIVAIFGVVVVAVLGATNAEAGRSGGHGGGHHGGGRSGSSRAHSRHTHGHGSKGCVDANDVLGYKRCSRFGDWSRITNLRPISIELLSVIRSLRFEPVAIRGKTGLEGRDFRYQGTTGERSATSMGFGFRGTIDLASGVYAGAELEIGGAMTSQRVQVSSDVEPLKAWQRGYVQGVGVLGVRDTIGETTVAAELAGGVLLTPVTAKYADDLESGDAHRTMLALIPRPAIEARVRAARWLSPWATIGAFAAADLAGAGYSAGLQLGLHLRAFDGGR